MYLFVRVSEEGRVLVREKFSHVDLTDWDKVGRDFFYCMVSDISRFL